MRYTGRRDHVLVPGIEITADGREQDQRRAGAAGLSECHPTLCAASTIT